MSARLARRAHPVVSNLALPTARSSTRPGATSEDAGPDRPVTFVLNGGPGASSTLLHLGALGPRRVRFGGTGRILASPARLVDNLESWLPFTDLVFIDPVGTGFSRVVKPPRDGQACQVWRRRGW